MPGVVLPTLNGFNFHQNQGAQRNRGLAGGRSREDGGWLRLDPGIPSPRGLVLQRPGNQMAHPNWTPLVTPSNFHSKDSFNTGNRAFELSWELEEAKRGKGRRTSPWMKVEGCTPGPLKGHCELP